MILVGLQPKNMFKLKYKVANDTKKVELVI